MHIPTIKDILSLPIPDSVELSANGKYIAYTKEIPNFRDNKYEKHCFVCSTESDKNIQLTHDGVASNIRWTGDDSIVLILSDASENKKAQAYLFKNLAGMPIQLTDHTDGIKSFEFFEQGILYIADDPDHLKERKSLYGDTMHVEQDTTASNLYYCNINKLLIYLNEVKSKDKISGDELIRPVLDLKKYITNTRTINSIIIPNSIKNQFIINTRKKDDLVFIHNTQSYKMDINIEEALSLYLESKNKEDDHTEKSAECSLTHLDLPEGSVVESYSPDDRALLISWIIGEPRFYKQKNLSYISFEQLEAENTDAILLKQSITKTFDRDFINAEWTKSGIYLSYPDYSSRKIRKFNLDGSSEEIRFDNFSTGFDFSVRDDCLATIVSNGESYFELAYHKNGKPKIITKMNEIISGWKIGKAESITWKSVDGLEIEGILRKPADFDPTRKYPLVFIVHGGPASASPCFLLSNYLSHYYPATQFLNQGILVLEPNYRGSIGRGEAFKEKYRENIGYGEMGDIESAIAHLIKKGFIDETKIGCMGWSQGGYISAFITTNSKKFTATSVGAGVSSWKTYYNSNDIRQWALHYLDGSPIEKPEYYKTTAPINNIKNAATPTLIQHGELDQRCPAACATELYRALMEMGVPTELFFFKGMPHGITKPRESLAILHQNFNWFSHYLLGSDLDLTGSQTQR